MATLVGTQSSLTGLLAALIELDMDAIEAYGVALERLRDPIHKQWLEGFMQDHERHVLELSCTLEKAHGDPPRGPDFKQYITKGKVVLADVVGNDYDILVAMHTNEQDTNTAYERATQHKEAQGELQALLERNLQDERRHRAWIEERITYLETQEEDRVNRQAPELRVD